jgi:serine/threonine-protein kinase
MRRYEAVLEIATGPLGVVHLGAATRALGSDALVVVARPHAADPAFVAALAVRARSAARLRHPNVVAIRDVEVDAEGVQIVTDYVDGASLAELADPAAGWTRAEPAVAIRIALDACEGLRALHELRDDDGRALGFVHGDVASRNVLVGFDGVARISGAGAPPRDEAHARDRARDVSGVAIALWEALARRPWPATADDGERRLAKIAPQTKGAAALDAVILRAAAPEPREPGERLTAIAELADALEAVAGAHDLRATREEVAASFPASIRAARTARRRKVQAAIASSSASDDPSFSSAVWSVSTEPADRSPFASPLAGSVLEPVPAPPTSPLAGSVLEPARPRAAATSPLAGSVLEPAPRRAPESAPSVRSAASAASAPSAPSAAPPPSDGVPDLRAEPDAPERAPSRTVLWLALAIALVAAAGLVGILATRG